MKLITLGRITRETKVDGFSPYQNSVHYDFYNRSRDLAPCASAPINGQGKDAECNSETGGT